MSNIVTEHPFISGGVGVGAMVIIGLIAWAASSFGKKPEKEVKAKTPEAVRVEARESRLNWSDSREAELGRDRAFAQYLDICLAVQKMRNELEDLRREQEKLHNQEMELAAKASELYSRCVEFGMHGEACAELEAEWKKANHELEIIRIKLAAIYQRLRELPEQIERLEAQKADFQQKYKKQLENFEKVKSKGVKKETKK